MKFHIIIFGLITVFTFPVFCKDEVPDSAPKEELKGTDVVDLDSDDKKEEKKDDKKVEETKKTEEEKKDEERKKEREEQKKKEKMKKKTKGKKGKCKA